MRPLDLQTDYPQMMEHGQSARSFRYAHVVLRSAMRQAVEWRLLLENSPDGVRVPAQPRNALRALTVERPRELLKSFLPFVCALLRRSGISRLIECQGGLESTIYFGLKLRGYAGY